MNKGSLDLAGVVGWEFTANSVKRELKAMGDVDEIDVYADSPGGDVDEGFGIYNALKNHKAKVNFHVTGMAYSMMSVIMTAGDSVTIEPTGMVMIHPPSTIVWGTASEMREGADYLDKQESRSMKAYQSRSLNLSNEELSEAVLATTWYTADEAVEVGFADSVVDGKGSLESEPSNSTMEWLRVASYKNIPESISCHLKTNRKKANSLKQKLILNDGPAVEPPTEGKTMTDEKTYSEAELQAELTKARAEANTDSQDNEAATVLASMLSDENATIDRVRTAAEMGLNAEQSSKFMAAMAAESAKTAVAPETVAAPVVAKVSLADQLSALIAKSEVNSVSANASTEIEEEKPKPAFDAKAEHARLTGAA